MKFVCIALETSGLAENCAVLEIGYISFDPAKPDDCEADVYLVNPDEAATFEQDAIEIHERSGLLEAIGEDGAQLLTLREAYEKCFAKREGRFVYWNKEFMQKFLPRDSQALDFYTLNHALSIFVAGNNPVRPTASRCANKLAAMRDVLSHWWACFRLAEKKL